MALVRRDGRRSQRGARGRPRSARPHARRLPGARATSPRPTTSDADVRPRRPPAAVPERSHPPPRRAGASRARRAPAVDHRPAGDARRAHRPRLVVPRARSPRLTSRACAGTSSTTSTAADIDGDGAHLRRHPGGARATTLTRAGDRAARGFGCHVANVGVKDDTDDFVVVAADAARRRPPGCSPGAASPARASRSAARTSPTAGPRRSSSCRRTPTSPTAPTGHADAEALVDAVAARLGCDAGDVLVASTGVIGRRYPMDRIARRHRRDAVAPPAAIVADRGRGRDHDHRHRAEGRRGDGRRRPGAGRRHRQGRRDDRARHGDDDRRRAHRRRRRPRTSSTPRSGGSSTARSTASASTPTRRPATPPSCWPAGRPVRSTADELEAALDVVAESLTKQIARDGEGAETLIEVVVDQARDRRPGQAGGQGDRQLAARQDRRARRRPELGSGGDGDRQVQDDTDIDQERVVIRFGDREVYPTPVDDAELAELSDYLRGDEVRIHVVARHRRRRRAPCGAATSPTATSASTPTTRPEPASPRDIGPSSSAGRARRGRDRTDRAEVRPLGDPQGRLESTRDLAADTDGPPGGVEHRGVSTTSWFSGRRRPAPRGGSRVARRRGSLDDAGRPIAAAVVGDLEERASHRSAAGCGLPFAVTATRSRSNVPVRPQLGAAGCSLTGPRPAGPRAVHVNIRHAMSRSSVRSGAVDVPSRRRVGTSCTGLAHAAGLRAACRRPRRGRQACRCSALGLDEVRRQSRSDRSSSSASAALRGSRLPPYGSTPIAGTRSTSASSDPTCRSTTAGSSTPRPVPGRLASRSGRAPRRSTDTPWAMATYRRDRPSEAERRAGSERSAAGHPRLVDDGPNSVTSAPDHQPATRSPIDWRDASLRRHADAAVDADRLGVEVAVGDALDDHRGQLLRGAEALREQHALLQVGLERLAVARRCRRSGCRSGRGRPC